MQVIDTSVIGLIEIKSLNELSTYKEKAMKKISQEELNKILELHKMWLNGEDSGISADLIGVNLRHTNLIGADLRNANLREADLRYADLEYANLIGADLSYCVGNNKEIKSLQLGTYDVAFTKNILCVGCQSHTLKEWKAFTDEEIAKMDDNALEWWKKWKDTLITIIKKTYERNR